MSYCRVCGDERNTQFYPAKRQTLCPTCAKDTPAKLGRGEFDRRYWGARGLKYGTPDFVPDSIRQSFYEDYLHSNFAFEAYKDSTTSYHM